MHLYKWRNVRNRSWVQNALTNCFYKFYDKNIYAYDLENELAFRVFPIIPSTYTLTYIFLSHVYIFQMIHKLNKNDKKVLCLRTRIQLV